MYVHSPYLSDMLNRILGIIIRYNINRTVILVVHRLVTTVLIFLVTVKLEGKVDSSAIRRF